MTPEDRPVEHGPVRSLHPRAKTSFDEARPGVVHRVVRRLKPKDKQGVPRPRQVLPAHTILLYRDEAIVEEMHDQVIAMALRDESIMTKFKRLIVGQPLLSGDFTFDGLAGVDEFVIRPSAKWTWGAEIGADIELKWNLGSNENTDNAILMLFSIMPIRNISEIVCQIEAQQGNTAVKDLIYPGMPISVRGTIQGEDDLLTNGMRLHDERNSAEVVLSQGHNLNQAFGFLRGRPLHVLGVIQGMQTTLNIKAGAVLPGEVCEEGPV